VKKALLAFVAILVVGGLILVLADGARLTQIAPQWLIIQLARQVAEPGPFDVPLDINVERDVVFAETDDGPLALDIYTPKIRPVERLPVIVFVFGGGWFAGNKYQIQRVEGHLWTRHGYAVIATSYRLSQVATFPAQIHDVKATVRWIRANANKYNFDENSIGAWGVSAGGHLVALLATTNGNAELEGDTGGPALRGYASDIQAVLDSFGVADLPSLTGPGVWMAEMLLGGRVSERNALARLASPETHASAQTAPLLILHGDKDETVPIEQSVKFHDRLQAVKANSTLHIIAGAGHGGEEFRTPAVREMSIDFFDEHLKSD